MSMRYVWRIEGNALTDGSGRFGRPLGTVHAIEIDIEGKIEQYVSWTGL